ncbi:MAG: glutathione S-transferase N-terminal domain-containing protein [Parcubacteria group bacterium]|nr:glutathione S-transferase N-terminal domain-containing protein [Parcubacteria group bacterium]
MSVKIYTTPTCQYCKLAKDFFKEKNIEYEEYNVATDIQKRQEMVERSGQLGVPVIDINGKFIIGFNQTQISEVLGIK